MGDVKKLKTLFAPLEGMTDGIFRRAHHDFFGGVEEYAIPFIRLTGDMALTVRFLCGQAYYGAFSTRTEDLPMTEAEAHGRKVLMNGQIVILRNGVRYTILGTKLD